MGFGFGLASGLGLGLGFGWSERPSPVAWWGGTSAGGAHHPSHAAVSSHEPRVLRAHDHAVRADRRTPSHGPRGGEDRLQAEERSAQAVVGRGERGERLLGALRLQEVRKQVPTADVWHNAQWWQRGAHDSSRCVEVRQPPPKAAMRHLQSSDRVNLQGVLQRTSKARTALSPGLSPYAHSAYQQTTNQLDLTVESSDLPVAGDSEWAKVRT